MIRLMSLTLLIFLIVPARAQNTALVSKPCDINEHMKGTCFYDANGVLTYWIARSWRSTSLGGGPEYALPEVVGYPAILKEQEEYNQWLKSIKPTPGLRIDVFKSSPYDERRAEKNIAAIMKETSDAMAGRYNPSAGYDTSSYSGTSPHGWDAASWGRKSMLIPAGISEDGGLTADALRIPFFMSGARILAAFDRLKTDCDESGSRYGMWADMQPTDARLASTTYYESDALRKYGLCGVRDLPKDSAFADWQLALKSRGDALATAEAASRRYDSIVESLRHTVYQYDTQSFTADQLPAGTTVRLSTEHRAVDAALRAEQALEEGNDDFTAKYLRLNRDLQTKRAAENGKRFDAEHPEYSAFCAKMEKEWMAKYGKHYTGCVTE